MAPALLARPGVGPVTATQVLISWSHPGRLRSEAAFAMLAGAAPIEASSGRVVLYRLPGAADLPPQRGPPKALSDYAALPIYSRTCVRYTGSVGTWHDLDVGRPLAAPLEQCAQLLGVDLVTVRELAAKVEPYLRADGTRIWSMTQLERQLRPEVYGPAPRRLARTSTNAAVALAGLTRLTGTSSNRNGPRHYG